MSSENVRTTDSDQQDEGTEQDLATPQEGQAAASDDLQNKYDGLNNKYIRLYADFENFRRRHASEKAQIAHHVKIDLVTSFLPCIDDIERGISSMKSHELDATQMLEGLDLVHNKITDVLVNAWSITLLGEVGEVFDPMVHEALSIVENEQYTQETIVEVYQKGYKLHDRVIRPAKVLVSKPKMVAEQSPEGADSAEVSSNTDENLEE